MGATHRRAAAAARGLDPGGPHRGAALPSWAVNLAIAMPGDKVINAAADELGHELKGLLVCVTTRQTDSEFRVEAVSGARGHHVEGIRIAYGAGLAGLALLKGCAAVTQDYARIPSPPELATAIVDLEGVRGAASQPLYSEGEPVGFIFAGRRDDGQLSDRQLGVLNEFAAVLGPMIGAGLAQEARSRRALEELRESIAMELHDEVIAPMFIIEALAKRVRTTLPDVEAPEVERIRADLTRIEEVSADVMSTLRMRLAGGGRSESLDLHARLRRAGLRYTLITGRSFDPVIVGLARVIPWGIADVLVAIARESTMNIAKHAGADANALVCLTYGPEHVELRVQDDGPGFDEEFVADLLADEEGPLDHGLRQMVIRARRQGGAIDFSNNEDGGACVKATFRAADGFRI